MKTNISKNRNDLRRARLRCGLEQKQVAFLLNQRSAAEISRYETGFYLPSLKTLLKLEVIYHMPIRLMFQRLFEECQVEVMERKREHTHILSNSDWYPKWPVQLKEGEFCFYANLLTNQIPTEPELKTVSKHILNLMNTTDSYKQGLDPYR
ncbi:MAG: helix-turn-helix transcriptional regulator [Chloracidobacterium sp.]|nr:helix-turn-helix transcriptional regulator [Chloracidobacterium sp.]